MVTGRQAASLLSVVLPTREHARLVLRAGLAGAPLRTSAVLLYDADRECMSESGAAFWNAHDGE